MRFLGLALFIALAASGCATPWGTVEPRADGAAPDAGADAGTGLDAGDAGHAPNDADRDAPSAFDAGTDVGLDGGPSVDPAERAACANLESHGYCGMTSDPGTCHDALVSLRDGTPPSCRDAYDAWIACLTAIDACPDGSGVLCPSEYAAFGACVNPPP